MHVLTLNQSLEDFRDKVAAKMQRPVYICAATSKWGTHHKRPNSSTYGYIGNIELYLSTWTDDGRCIKREPIDDNTSHDHYYYDLSESALLCIVFPIKLAEITRETSISHPIFCDVGLRECGQYKIIEIGAGDRFPKELDDYIENRKSARGRPRDVIMFAESCGIMRPKHYREEWHIGYVCEKFSTLQPPGKYHDSDITSLSYFNNFAIVDKDPGSCIVCSGEKKERKHLAHLAFGQEVYPTNLICKGCVKESIEQISELL